MTKTIAEGWMDQGRLEAGRRIFREDLELQFGTLPEDLLARIAAIDDFDRLLAARRQARQIEKLEDLQL